MASANVEEIPRPLLWGASRDSLRDQDESSIIADSMIAQSFHYLPLRPVVCVLVRCRRRQCLPHDPKSCSRRASRRRAWRRRCSRWHVPLALPGTVLRICVSVVGSVCVCLLARLLRGVAPRFSCPCLFVGLVLVRARWVIASGWRSKRSGRSRCCFASFSVSPRFHHGTRLNDDPRSFSCHSARHLIMARWYSCL